MFAQIVGYAVQTIVRDDYETMSLDWHSNKSIMVLGLYCNPQNTIAETMVFPTLTAEILQCRCLSFHFY